MTSVASRSITTCEMVLLAARDPGTSLPVSSPRASHARSLACARASRIFASIPGVFGDGIQDPPDRGGSWLPSGRENPRDQRTLRP